MTLALGCMLASGCDDAALRRALKGDDLSVGARQSTRLNLQDCSNTECSRPALAAEPAGSLGDAAQIDCEIGGSWSPAWQVSGLPKGLEECGASCEPRFDTKTAVAEDGSLWVLAAGLRGGTASPDGATHIGGTTLLFLVHHDGSGIVLSAHLVDSDDAPELEYAQQLAVLDSGRVAAVVHKRARTSDGASLRSETWIATFESDGRPVGDRIQLDTTVIEPYLIAPSFAPAGGDKLAFADSVFAQPGDSIGVGVVDLGRRAVQWVQSRERLPLGLFDVVAADGEVSALAGDPGAQLRIDRTIEHYGEDGQMAWARSVALEGYGAAALSRGSDGDVVYAAVLAQSAPAPAAFTEHVVLYELDATGESVTRVRSPLPDRGTALFSGYFASPRVAVLEDGALLVPIGDRAVSEELGLQGSLFYELSADRRECMWHAFTGYGLAALLPARDGGLYFSTGGSYGLIEDPFPTPGE
jgi:hypothetical protein